MLQHAPTSQGPDAVLLTTTDHVEGRPIRHVVGLVHGETILGVNLFRDLLAGIRDLVGGRAKAYETALERAREMALAELQERALLLGADAVVGLRIDVEVLGQGGMLMVCANGTAAKLEGQERQPPPSSQLPDHPLPPPPRPPRGR
jgi:uncharacterized protein YbjQ (UPF0145 family)